MVTVKMISFDPLWETLGQQGIKRTELMKRVGFSKATLAKMGKDQAVSLDVLERICLELKVPISSVVEIVQDPD